jgi:hypothetical protein
MLNRRGLIASRERIESKLSNIITKGTMEAQQNPNEPGKPNVPGQQQEERERQERERQQREREKQGGGGGQERGGSQQGGR